MLKTRRYEVREREKYGEIFKSVKISWELKRLEVHMGVGGALISNQRQLISRLFNG